ncbi:hypothetical protein CDL15_Pgr024886 [Punica granatum]|uniref:Uncharacterized protein n=1 Tax=Punica granatum TaxID=22663 RepID=A0A218XDF7_PUNGR|nr:hypothetical protein CDL15_Pgr024886 [Punica granatum]
MRPDVSLVTLALRGIFGVPYWAPFGASGRLAILLGLCNEEIRCELQYGGEHSIRITWLIDFIQARALNATGESYQRDACHEFLLLIFGTMLFPYSSNLIDGALARSSSKWWADTTLSLPDRVLRVREVRRLWSTRIVQELYFPEHPTDEERAFSATATYVMQFHPYGFAPVRQLRIPQMLQIPQANIPDAKSSVQGAMHTELQVIRAERDRLRYELVDIRAELTDHREFQSELAQTHARIVSQDREIARLSAMLDRARARARTISHP